MISHLRTGKQISMHVMQLNCLSQYSYAPQLTDDLVMFHIKKLIWTTPKPLNSDYTWKAWQSSMWALLCAGGWSRKPPEVFLHLNYSIPWNKAQKYHPAQIPLNEVSSTVRWQKKKGTTFRDINLFVTQ